MKRIKTIALALCLLAAASVTAAAQSSMINSNQAAPEKSLYQRVGGYDAIAAVVDDFVGRLVGDKQFARFFAGHSTDSLKRIRQHIVDQFCAAAGGPLPLHRPRYEDDASGPGYHEGPMGCGRQTSDRLSG